MSAKETTPWIGEAKLSKDDYQVEAVADGKCVKVVVRQKDEQKLRVELAQSLLDAKRKEGGRPLNAQALQALVVMLVQVFAPSAEGALPAEWQGNQAQTVTLFLREVAAVYVQENRPEPASFARLFVQAVGDERAILLVTMSRDQICGAIEKLAETDSSVGHLATEQASAYWNDVYSEIKKIVLPPDPS